MTVVTPTSSSSLPRRRKRLPARKPWKAAPSRQSATTADPGNPCQAPVLGAKVPAQPAGIFFGTVRSGSDAYFPRQNALNIVSSRSSVAVFPTTSPTAFAATRISSANKSKGTPDSIAAIARSIAAAPLANASR